MKKPEARRRLAGEEDETQAEEEGSAQVKVRYVYTTLCAVVLFMGVVVYIAVTHWSGVLATVAAISFLVGLPIGALAAHVLRRHILNQTQPATGLRALWPWFLMCLAYMALYFLLPPADRQAATLGGSLALSASMFGVLSVQTLRVEREIGKRVFAGSDGITTS